MRKQKASDKRTSRRQKEGPQLLEVLPTTITASPMQNQAWTQKVMIQEPSSDSNGGGRQRSRKRSNLYNRMARYHNTFLNALTLEYKAEEEQVLGRIKASLEDPLGLETAGHCFYDMQGERRGNLFADEVYRLHKAADATTLYTPPDENSAAQARYLPPNHKFAINDVILLTLQPSGSGDFFSINSLPTSETAISVEARVLNMGPTYLDIVVPAGSFPAAFGAAPNDYAAGEPNRESRIRVDRFFSNVPYQRMVSALSMLTNIPAKASEPKEKLDPAFDMHMDHVLREVILQTFSGREGPNRVQELINLVSKPAMGNSIATARLIIKYIKSNSKGTFPTFNTPQLMAVEAALTQRLTLIHGPPGSGKTTVAAAIAFGFAHQCRSMSSPHSKVLACAFSNVGADNLAEAMRSKLGLKVIRIGKPSALSETLWDVTLDAAIDRDPDAQKALRVAAKATAALTEFQRNKKSASNSASERALREAATAAVKASIQACNLAATKALREADVIVSTSTGAADPRLLAACGIPSSEAEIDDKNSNSDVKGSKPLASSGDRLPAPDGLPPLSLPFVLIDEACQSVEPASLIPIVSSDTCRSLVLLGDPCQLPPTVKSLDASDLSLSLMERLAAILPPSLSVSNLKDDSKQHDTSYIDSLSMKQAKSLLRYRDMNSEQSSYRKRFSGSLLLSVQYRMHPSIAAFPSAVFYDGLLSTPSFMAHQRSFPKVLAENMPCADGSLCVRVVDVGGGSNENQGLPTRFSKTVFGSASDPSLSLEDQTTYWNEAEAEVVLSLIRDIVFDKSKEVQSIGVITPYQGQVQLLKSMIAGSPALRKGLAENQVSIEVKSVDGYQGRERDVIIFSAVRSNRQARIGFVRDWRRMNVALTRAKAGLVIVGDLDTLAEADKHWDGLRKWASGVRCIIDDSDGPDEEPSQ
ncbi:hypothetical protein FisN_16Hh176 [Fistulifera solaris]|uniref:AAA+ ATPase domain-containing protein n=1 Tax=Fistulifera solaris TaxID=1519565 RepID=A0A1Z5KSU4_FISSO|nr:hypothetical protein FisN_16Hh176 [Fistulifera solaris]|eukprot:GAX29384.1 hypothetical protein FisN_16Hh176 [Fistulifera solaris]